MSGLTLALETSCDESALALFDPQQGLVGEWVHSQIALHQPHGGVVPDLASRAHLKHLGPLLQQAIAQSPPSTWQSLAVTIGPGLAGCLAMGIATAQALALAYPLPLLGINHLRAHAFSPFIGVHAEAPDAFAERLDSLLPHLGLLVSGGNTLLFALAPDHSLHLLARTLDDAAGEALDKGAKLLGMPYPGGPHIEKLACSGDPHRYDFPKAFSDTNELKFSFSGLKTSLRYRMEKLDDEALAQALPDLCASYQQAVIDALAHKTRQALRQTPYRSLGLSGGVANNTPLRTTFAALAQEHHLPLYTAAPRHTGDNAAMVAFAAHADPAGIHFPAPTLTPQPTLPLT